VTRSFRSLCFSPLFLIPSKIEKRNSNSVSLAEANLTLEVGPNPP
jgi:hypothetical protein